VRALLRRDMRTRVPLLQCGDLTLDPATRTAYQDQRRLALTRKEFGILEYLLRRCGEVVSQEELLEHVWNAQANLFTNTVRVHVNALRRKLGDTATTPRYIETVVGMGYRLDDFAGRRRNLTETLSLPEYASSIASAEAEQRRNAMSTRSWADQIANAPRLLIVEDAPDINQLLTVFFHQAGYNTLAAYDGRAALDLFGRERPDLVILDLGLPDMDGLEVCRQLRQESAVPILMLTKRGELEDRVKGYAAGADAYLVKPFMIEEVQAAVQALLRRGSATPPMSEAG
jgi:DNA-binding response OmpR family regulator